MIPPVEVDAEKIPGVFYVGINIRDRCGAFAAIFGYCLIVFPVVSVWSLSCFLQPAKAASARTARTAAINLRIFIKYLPLFSTFNAQNSADSGMSMLLFF